jgi:hypothetical protein
MRPGTARSSPLWAVTSYFNPAGFRRRRENYRVFRDHLDVPLATVELSFNGRFELGPQDAEMLIQINGRDVMWQKERLLNVAVQALPAHCTKVAFLDCDVVFVWPDWASLLSRRLDEVPLAQPFTTVHYPPPDVPVESPGVLAGDFQRPSVGHLLEQGWSNAQILGNFTARRPGSRSTGHALAARRDLLQVHGLYDAAIIGGGDYLLVSAALGEFQEVIQYQIMNAAQANHYLAWGERFHRDVGRAMGCVAGDLIHLWHGTMEDRGSPWRYQGLSAYDFNPVQDIDLDSAGCWRWSSAKPEMHAFVRDYFATRHEDGRDLGKAHQPAALQSAAA